MRALSGSQFVVQGVMDLPGSFNGKHSQAISFFGVHLVLDDGVDAAAAGSAAEGLTQRVERGGIAFSHHFDVAVFSVAHPTAELEGGGFALDEPAKTHALYASTNEKVANHWKQAQCFKLRGGAQPDVTIRVRAEKGLACAVEAKPIIDLVGSVFGRQAIPRGRVNSKQRCSAHLD